MGVGVRGRPVQRTAQGGRPICTTLIQRIDALDAAKIITRGLTSTAQLKLHFDFTTAHGTAFNAALVGRLTRDGTYDSVTLWQDNSFGSVDVGGAPEAADVLDERVGRFVNDWKGTHGTSPLNGPEPAARLPP